MNSDQLKGAAKDAAGKIQREVGGLTGDHSQQAKGAVKQVEGKTQKAAGDMRDAVERDRSDVNPDKHPIDGATRSTDRGRPDGGV